MKTLEQLGISPAPWEAGKNPAIADVLDGYEGKCIYANGDVNTTPYVGWANVVNGNTKLAIRNAHLIAAAPKLYAACYEMLRYYYEQNTNTTVFNTALELMKQAVAEAAGESEVEK